MLDPGRPSLSGAGRDALESLCRDGLAIVTFDDLIEDAELWADLVAEMRDYMSNAQRHADQSQEQTAREGRPRKRTKEDYILRATKIDHPVTSPVMLRYALSAPLLAIANTYLGVASKLVYVDKWYTTPSPADAARIKSQRWHRDPMDHVVKVFTYFSDVDGEAGALEYVRASATGGAYGDVLAWDEHNLYPPEGEVERLLPKSAFAEAAGPAGTIVIADTGGFHRGGFCRRPRATATFTYASPAWAVARGSRLRVDGTALAGLSPDVGYALS